MHWIKKDNTGKVIDLFHEKWNETFEYTEEEYFRGFDGQIYSYSEMQSTNYKERESAYLYKKNSDKLNEQYIPKQYDSIKVFAKTYLKVNPPKDTEEKMLLSGLYETWQLGNYVVGDIRNYAGQTWECHQAHNNATFPDINPNKQQTWATFWRPLHGKSKETARPWTKPWAGTTDMYHTGEYMIYADGKVYKCKSNTNFSPEEYAAAWEVVNE